jgi:glycosyltransferase involved in cell wall biosynthesis/2-polyprenyl-3-methyl-5-hydroxy-6-metoxy-1,4-benzoquinol methylase
MFKVNKQKKQTDLFNNWPNIPSFEERLSKLCRSSHRVAYFYEFPDNSTFRYRVYNMIQALESKKGFSASFFTNEDSERLNKVIEKTDVFVICRSRYTHNLNQAITKAKLMGKRVIFDIDDLVFDLSYMHLVLNTLDQELNHPSVWDTWAASFGRMFTTLSLCDEVITTNDFLANQIKKLVNKPTHVIPNFMNKEQVEFSETLYKSKISNNFSRDKFFHIGYFSGTPTHNKDFAVAADALYMLLEKYQNLKLIIVGFMDIKGPLLKYSNRIEKQPLQNFVELQYLMSKAEINIIPLQDNDFTNCKSELKYFEAGITGTLSVATPTFTYSNAIREGENGFLANSYEWYEKLTYVIDNFDDISKAVGEKAHNDSLSKYSWENQIDLIEKTLFSYNEESITPPIESVIGNDSDLTRNEKLLSCISLWENEGLEIGPLCTPIVKKTESNGKVSYIDFASKEELKEKYKNDPNVAVDDIVDVDYLWGERTLPELVDNKLFDYVIASHVIEHVPDMLGWLKEIGDVLYDNGVLSLAVPDKRYSFDIIREISSPGMIIEAHLLHKRRPSSREIFDHIALIKKVDIVKAWDGNLDIDNLKGYGNPNDAYNLALESINSEKYNDVHVNIFTPTSFLDLLEIFSNLELIDFAIKDFYNTVQYNLEFIITLERLPRNGLPEERLKQQLSSINWARSKIFK